MVSVVADLGYIAKLLTLYYQHLCAVRVMFNPAKTNAMILTLNRSQQPLDLRIIEKANARQIHDGDTLFHRCLDGYVLSDGSCRILILWIQDSGQRTQQLSLQQYHGQHSTAVSDKR